MKKILCFFLFLLLPSSLISCSVSETAPPHQLFEEIEKSYGALPPGLFFDSRAKEWEENYLDSDVIEHVFGDEKEYKEAVASAYFYLSSSLSVSSILPFAISRIFCAISSLISGFSLK